MTESVDITLRPYDPDEAVVKLDGRTAHMVTVLVEGGDPPSEVFVADVPTGTSLYALLLGLQELGKINGKDRRWAETQQLHGDFIA